MPTEDECQVFRDAKNPSVHHEVRGAILRHYRELGGEKIIGRPTSDEHDLTKPHLTRYGDRGMTFGATTIILNSATGEVTHFRWDTFRPATRVLIDPDPQQPDLRGE